MGSNTPSVDLAVADGIATILINNPLRRNCFEPAMFDQLFDAAERIAADASVRIAVLRGAGEKAFSAGVDIDAVTESGEYFQMFLETEARMNRATEAVAALSIPVVAALKGSCMGGGVLVAVAADFRLACDDLRLAIPAASLGVMYPLAPIETMVRMAGPSAVKKLLIEGGEMDATTALSLGFVEEVAPAEAFEVRLGRILAHIAAHPPEIVAAYKTIIDNYGRGDPGTNEIVRDRALNSGILAERLAGVAQARREARARRDKEKNG